MKAKSDKVSTAGRCPGGRSERSFDGVEVDIEEFAANEFVEELSFKTTFEEDSLVAGHEGGRRPRQNIGFGLLLQVLHAGGQVACHADFNQHIAQQHRVHNGEFGDGHTAHFFDRLLVWEKGSLDGRLDRIETVLANGRQYLGCDFHLKSFSGLIVRFHRQQINDVLGNEITFPHFWGKTIFLYPIVNSFVADILNSAFYLRNAQFERDIVNVKPSNALVVEIAVNALHFNHLRRHNGLGIKIADSQPLHYLKRVGVVEHFAVTRYALFGVEDNSVAAFRERGRSV